MRKRAVNHMKSGLRPMKSWFGKPGPPSPSSSSSRLAQTSGVSTINNSSFVSSNTSGSLVNLSIGVVLPPPPTPHALPAASVKPEQSLWEAAYDKLSEEYRQKYPFKGSDHRDYLKGLLEITTESRDICQEKKWKFQLYGKEIIVRDLADKLLVWLDKFKAIGDIVVQYDPTHAALPWAGIRFLMQIALGDKDTMAVILVGVEAITKLLVRCAIYENLYINPNPKLPNHENLSSSLIELYAAVLTFLAEAKKHLEKKTIARVLGGIWDVEGKKPLLDTLKDCESGLGKEISLAEALCRRNDRDLVEGKMRTILRDLERPILRMARDVTDIYEQLQDDKRLDILLWLSNIQYKNHHQHAKQGLLENSGQWLQKKDQYLDWRMTSASSILWLHGIPGAGKTKLTCTVVDALIQANEPVIWFYCDKKDDERRDPAIIMRTLLHQLCINQSQSTGLPKPVLDAYEKRSEDGFSSGPLAFEESEALVSTLLDMYPQVTIIIDGLDEIYPNERTKLLEAFRCFINTSSTLVKVFVSSRDIEDIVRELENVPNLYIHTNDNWEDIQRFIHREIMRGGYSLSSIDERLRQQIVDTLVAKSNGMFLWADLQIRHLRDLKITSDILRDLGKLPATLKDTYDQIYEVILAQKGSGPEIAKTALRWIMCSKRPLQPEEWVDAIIWELGLDYRIPFRTLLDLCHNLVIEDKLSNVVRFAHLSVQEYLENDTMHKEFATPRAHTMIARTCLLHLIHVDDYEFLIRQGFTRYCSFYFADHVHHSDAAYLHQEIVDLLQQFFWRIVGDPSSAYRRWYGHMRDNDVSWVMSGTRDTFAGLRDPEALYNHIGGLAWSPLFVLCSFDLAEKYPELWSTAFAWFDIDCLNFNNETLLCVASKRGNTATVQMLLDRGADVNSFAMGMRSFESNPLLQAIEYGQAEVMRLLLQRGADLNANRRGKRYIDALEAILRVGSADFLDLYLENTPDVRIMEEHLVAAAVHPRAEAMLKLVRGRNPALKLTEAVLLAAASIEAGPLAYRNMQLLLNMDSRCEITEKVLVTAAAHKSGTIILALLIHKLSPGYVITHRVLLVLINEQGTPYKDIKLMLDRHLVLDVTPATLAAAAGHSTRYDADGEQLKDNTNSAYTTLKLLLDADHGYHVSEEVVLAAASQPQVSKAAMGLLLDRLKCQTNVTVDATKVLLAIIKHQYYPLPCLQLLLDSVFVPQISEDALLAAAKRDNCAEAIVEFLLTLKPTLKVTEEVLLAAVGRENRYSGWLLDLLLDREPEFTCKVTQAVLLKAARTLFCEPTVRLLLDRELSLEVTQEILRAATNRPCSASFIQLLLSRNPALRVDESTLWHLRAREAIQQKELWDATWEDDRYRWGTTPKSPKWLAKQLGHPDTSDVYWLPRRRAVPSNSSLPITAAEAHDLLENASKLSRRVPHDHWQPARAVLGRKTSEELFLHMPGAPYFCLDHDYPTDTQLPEIRVSSSQGAEASPSRHGYSEEQSVPASPAGSVSPPSREIYLYPTASLAVSEWTPPVANSVPVPGGSRSLVDRELHRRSFDAPFFHRARSVENSLPVPGGGRTQIDADEFHGLPNRDGFHHSFSEPGLHDLLTAPDDPEKHAGPTTEISDVKSSSTDSHGDWESIRTSVIPELDTHRWPSKATVDSDALEDILLDSLWIFEPPPPSVPF